MNENYSNNKLLTIFNLTSFVTVSTLERKSTENQPGQQNNVYVQSITIWIKLQVQLSPV